MPRFRGWFGCVDQFWCWQCHCIDDGDDVVDFPSCDGSHIWKTRLVEKYFAASPGEPFVVAKVGISVFSRRYTLDGSDSPPEASGICTKQEWFIQSFGKKVAEARQGRHFGWTWQCHLWSFWPVLSQWMQGRWCFRVSFALPLQLDDLVESAHVTAKNPPSSRTQPSWCIVGKSLTVLCDLRDEQGCMDEVMSPIQRPKKKHFAQLTAWPGTKNRSGCAFSKLFPNCQGICAAITKPVTMWNWPLSESITQLDGRRISSRSKSWP